MDEASKDTAPEELDKGVQQLQSGLCQLTVTAQDANSSPALTQHCRPNCGSQLCSFPFNSGVPRGGSDDSAETQRVEPGASSTPPQGLKHDINACPSDTEEEHLKGVLRQEPRFKFNFTVSEADADVDQTGWSRLEPAQSEQLEDFECSASKPLQKKKSKTRKNKPAAGLRDQKKLSHNSQGEEVNSASLKQEHSLSQEEQLQREVDWCIEQLDLGLRSQKANRKQAAGALHAVRTLCSDKAPLVKKRQVMRSIFGDYRKKMEEERQRQFRLMLAATKSATIKAIGTQPRSQVFRKTTNKLSKVGAPPTSDPVSPERITVDPDDQSYFQFNFF